MDYQRINGQKRPLALVAAGQSSSSRSLAPKGDVLLDANTILNSDIDLKLLHTRLESNSRLARLGNKPGDKPDFSNTMSQQKTDHDLLEPASNRLLSSHLSVFQTLENSELNDMKDVSNSHMAYRATDSNKCLTDQDPAAFSITSWQSVGSVPVSNISDPNQQSSGPDSNSHGLSVNSILSLSSDNEDRNSTEHDITAIRDFRNTRRGSVNTVKLSTLLSGNRGHRLDDTEKIEKDFDSDDSGTFEIDMNALIKNNNSASQALKTGTLSPSFIMPKMIVASQSTKIKTKYIRICVIGNGLEKIQKNLNEYNKVTQTNTLESTCSLQYLFTNLNTKVDCIILVFDAINGLYSKDLFNIIASYKKSVLPVIYQGPTNKRRKSKAKFNIVSGGISDNSETENDYPEEYFDVNESMVISLLLNNGIKLFNSPVRIEDIEPLTFENLHSIIYSNFASILDESDHDGDGDDDSTSEDNEHIQSSTSTWASKIIQHRNGPEGVHRRMSASRHNSSRSGTEPLKAKKRRISGSSSSSFTKNRRKKIDKKKLSFSKINNSDPLKLSEKKKFVVNTFFSIGIGLSIVTAITVIAWYKKAHRGKFAVIQKPAYRKFFSKAEFKRFVSENNVASASLVSNNQQASKYLGTSLDEFVSFLKNVSIDLPDLDTLITSAKKMIYKTRVIILGSFSSIRYLFDNISGFLFVC